jgi:hypothetical protein
MKTSRFTEEQIVTIVRQASSMSAYSSAATQWLLSIIWLLHRLAHTCSNP